MTVALLRRLNPNPTNHTTDVVLAIYTTPVYARFIHLVVNAHVLRPSVAPGFA